jgi:hypothetical protein
MSPRAATAAGRRTLLARAAPACPPLIATVAAALVAVPVRTAPICASLLATVAAALVAIPARADSPAHEPRRAIDAATSPVLLVGPDDVRLLVQIRRELATSGFPIIERGPAADVGPGAAFDPARTLAPGTRAAVVVDGDSRVRIWIARDDAAPALLADLAVHGTDPHARRRACLAVVEYLRFGASGAPGQVRAASASASSSASDSAESLPSPAQATAPFDPAPTDLLLAAALAAGGQAAPGPRRPWGMSAATTVNFDSGMGEPTSHAQLTAQLPVGERWAITVAGLWPVLGAQFQTPEQVVRMWTMGAAAGLRWALPRPLPRVQPFLGAALGARFVLSDAESIETRQARVVFTTSATAGGSAGLLVQLRPLVHLLLEGNVAWMGMLPQGSRTRWETAAARGRAAHAALGVLFEY